MMNNYKASVIIPTYNKLSYLKLTLFSILQQCHEDIQLVIVNDGSDDGTGKYLETFRNYNNVVIVKTCNGGRSSARNLGAEMAGASLLIFIDDDVLFETGFIESHIKCHQERNVVVHGLIKELPFLKAFSSPSEPLSADGKKHANMEKYLIYEEIIEKDFERIRKMGRLGRFEADILELCERVEYSEYHWISTIGANMSVRKDTFWNIGGFDCKLGKEWGCEDLELGYRARLKGFHNVINRQASLYHMTHYRENGMVVHRKAMEYFYNKHKTEELLLLNDYFTGSIKSLTEWAGRCMERKRKE